MTSLCLFLYSTILLEIDGPIPGNCSSSVSLAVLILTIELEELNEDCTDECELENVNTHHYHHHH